MLKSIRSAAVLGAVPLLALSLASPAQARSHWVYKSTDVGASASWTEWGELPNVVGNAHVGYLEVSGSGSNVGVWGEIADYQCDPGEIPGGGGHGEFEDEPPAEGECEFTGSRFINGGTVTFSVDRKLTNARLVGNLVVENHGTPGATPPVDMTWTGQGGLSGSTYIDEYTEDGVRYYSKYESTYRDALVSGAIGIMDFTDDEDDESYASIQKTKSFERASSR